MCYHMAEAGASATVGATEGEWKGGEEEGEEEGESSRLAPIPAAAALEHAHSSRGPLTRGEYQVLKKSPQVRWFLQRIAHLKDTRTIKRVG